MTDSTLRLPQEGTGPFTPAIVTSNISGDQVKIPLSLTAGFRTYTAVAMSSPATPNRNHLALMNASGSNLTVRVWDIKANVNLTTAADVGSIVLNTARISDVGAGGSGQTIRKLDTKDASLPAQVTAHSSISGMTITSNELASCNVFTDQDRNTLYKAESVLSPLVLNEGQGLLVQQGTLSGVAPVNVFMYFTTD